MASSDVLSRTLHSITGTKLDEISKQRKGFESAKADLLVAVDAKTDPCQRVQTLLDAFENIPALAVLTGSPATSYKNIEKFVVQASRDPSVSTVQLKDWEDKLRKELDVQSLRYEYASLYGQLVNEWLADSSSDKKTVPSGGEGAAFENVGRKEKHDQRATWEGYVFKPLDVDSKNLVTYLDGFFASSKEIKKTLEELRNTVTQFANEDVDKVVIDEDALDWCIKGILRSDLLTDEKRAVLLDFQRNKVVLAEIIDVLNMRLSSINTWSWGSEGTPVEQRRQLNGRYRFYHDEDLLQLIFLRYIGVRWSVALKRAFTHFRNDIGSWKTPGQKKITKEQRKRLNYFLDKSSNPYSVSESSEKIFDTNIFLEQLQDEEEEVGPGYDDNSTSSDDTKTETPQQTTQKVIRLLAIDVAMRSRFGEDVSVVRSDFKWFGPSLPHDTMFTILRYFGVPEMWVSFFKRVLEAPMKFVEDGPDAPVQIRKRGTPISGPLSNMLGETVLFCLDFAFNQKTAGATTLYRLHDDIWFWGSQEACEKGWGVLTEFSRLTGLELSEEKTGSVEVRSSKSKASARLSILPKGPVSWGFLKLNPEGRFVIDQESVKKHIAELQLQLSACKSVFDYIQAWNIYASRFFTTNFGKPCNIFGPAHIDEILTTFQEIQHSVFGPSGSITSKIKSMLTERFGVTNIPEGYLFFPLDMGGLDLKSPFVVPYLVREQVLDPIKLLDDFLENEEERYTILSRAWEDPDSYGRSRKRNIDEGRKPKDSEKFMTFDEYKSYRFIISGELGHVFKELLKEPSECDIEATKEVTASLHSNDWSSMEGYKKWIVALYGNDMIERFGGLSIVEKGLLPTGMISMFRQSRFNWEG